MLIFKCTCNDSKLKKKKAQNTVTLFIKANEDHKSEVKGI